MNRDDVQARYQLPSQLLADYESWRKKQADGQSISSSYTADNIVDLRLMLNLQQLGFSANEIENFLSLTHRQPVPSAKLIAMLIQHRQGRLAMIHRYERQIAGIDYLRFQFIENN